MQNVGAALQRHVLEVYGEALACAHVTPEGNFYDLGGDSLTALEIAGCLSEWCGVEVSLELILTADTIEEVIDALASSAAGGHRDETTERSAPDDRLRASIAQEWAAKAIAAEPAAPVFQIAFAYRLFGRLDPKALELALQSVIDRHESLRTTFDIVGEDVFRRITHHRVRIESLEVARDLEDREAHGRRLLERAVQRRIDHFAGPPLRAVLVRLSETERLLGLTISHLVADGASVGVITSDLSMAYEMASEGASPRWATEAPAYGTWAQAQRTALAAGRAERVVAFWREQIADRGIFAVPRGRRRSAAGLAGPAQLKTAVRPSVLSGAEALAQRARVTTFAVLAAALALVLAEETNRTKVAFQTSVSNRQQPHIRECVGWFANGIYPTVTVGERDTFVELAQRVAQTVAAAAAHGDVAMGLVRRRIWPDEPPGFRTMPLVYFMYEGMPWEDSLQLAGVHGEALDLPSQADSPGVHVWIYRLATGAQLACLYHRTEYEAPAVERFAQRFLATLERAIADPHAVCRSLVVSE